MSAIRSILLSGMALPLCWAGPAAAIEFKAGPLDVDLMLQADAQGAYFDNGVDETDTGSNIDWTLRLNVEHVFLSGWVVGARAEYSDAYDIDTDDEPQDIDTELDEIYVYAAGAFGRVEVGRQDGPADTLSLHAPQVGLGQVRGDFARYVSGPASFSPYDTRNEPKAIYLSPPIGGLRFGISYGPEMRINEDDPNPLLRTIQDNHVEVAVQFQQPLEPGVVLGLSGAYVHAEADPVTMREDISSWSAGAELRWQNLRVGGAYVSRGDSNSFAGRDEEEINLGAAWLERRWSVAASAAHIERSDLTRDLAGIGGSFEVNDYITLGADIVGFSDDVTLGGSNSGFAVMGQIRLRL
jgi:hypothetical protein